MNESLAEVSEALKILPAVNSIQSVFIKLIIDRRLSHEATHGIWLFANRSDRNRNRNQELDGILNIVFSIHYKM